MSVRTRQNTAAETAFFKMLRQAGYQPSLPEAPVVMVRRGNIASFYVLCGGTIPDDIMKQLKGTITVLLAKEGARVDFPDRVLTPKEAGMLDGLVVYNSVD